MRDFYAASFLAQAYLATKAPDKAAVEFKKILANRGVDGLSPQYPLAYLGLARALQDLQRYDEAISVAQQITELDPDDVLAYTSLSVLYQKKGMIPEAEAEGAKARVLGWKQQLKKS